jgi:hypothetical protein
MRGIFLAFVASLGIAPLGLVSAQDYAVGPNLPAKRPSQWIEGQGREITLKGEQTCLKQRNRAGRQLLSCAIGFRGDDEKFYGLRDTDPQYRNVSGPGHRKQITGTLWPALSDEYIEEGIIEIRKAIPIDDDPKILVGEYACLPTRAKPPPNHRDCTKGIQTRSGFYWAFYTVAPEAREPLAALALGDPIEIKGTVATYVAEENWTLLWRNHPEIEAALRVTGVKRNR